jgi:hypothetical protein
MFGQFLFTYRTYCFMIHNITPTTTINGLNHNYKDLRYIKVIIYILSLSEVLYSYSQIKIILYIQLIYQTYFNSYLQ